MLAMASVLGRLPPVTGRRVAIVTTSGGSGGWAADILSGEGLEVPQPSGVLRERLEALMPSFGSSANPIDVTGNVVEDGGVTLAKVIAEISDSDDFDAILVIVSLTAVGRIATMRPLLEPVLGRRKLPVLFHSPGIPSADNVQALQQIGAGVLSLREAALAIRGLARYGGFQAARARPSAGQTLAAPLGVQASGVLPYADGALPKRSDVRAILDAYGIPTPPEALAGSADQAVEIATSIGFPVVMKIESADVPHKTDAGCVELSITDADGCRAAYRRILENALKHRPEARIEGVLVQKQLPPGTEMVVGMTRDPDFGPMILLGLGGIFVEVLRDSVIAPAPLSEEQARAMVGRLKGRAMLEGVRGQPPRDVDALVSVLVGLSRLAIDAGKDLAEADLNPVIVYPQGQGAVAVDYLFVRGGSASASTAHG
jgi:acetyltransferase